MNKFMVLHFGFSSPTPEMMDEWDEWFKLISNIQLGQGGFMGGKEISKAGVKELTFDQDAIMGYNIIEAENLEAAEKIIATCPFISSVRVYAIR